MSKREEPLLGLATTEELFREIIARFTVHFPHHPSGQFINTERALSMAEILGGLSAVEKEYRTINSE